MTDDGEATIHDAAGITDADGRQSSQAMEACSDEASGDGLGDDPRPLAQPPVGCTSFPKSLKNQHLGDALCPKCSPTVSPTTVAEDRQRQSNGLRASMP